MTPDGTKFALFVKPSGESDFRPAGLYIDASIATKDDAWIFAGAAAERIAKASTSTERTRPDVAMPELKHRDDQRQRIVSDIVRATTCCGEVDARAVQYDCETSPRFGHGPSFEYLLEGVTSWRTR